MDPERWARRDVIENLKEGEKFAEWIVLSVWCSCSTRPNARSYPRTWMGAPPTSCRPLFDVLDF